MEDIALNISYGVQRNGLWCEQHALPHLWEVTTYVMHPGGAVTPGRTLRGCDQDEE